MGFITRGDSVGHARFDRCGRAVGVIRQGARWNLAHDGPLLIESIDQLECESRLGGLLKTYRRAA